ncbi:6-phospho-beta-glucosidase [Edaphobacter aggregans]|uniref:6-phospho-beta-glucosidase n=1 Tax=Edaphobacter aggregans TaxID=570835 RepID=A0A3R9PDG3_9BACT|nr:6-phospho-beta-glucosidase [Edaphobacter aggregans]RSL19256.1 6-phospho-beta-glucosidase [Edaphobacter aggregans]
MSKLTRRKIAFIGGGGVRTPLVVFGVNESVQSLGAEELVLFDPDRDRVRIMAELGRSIVAQEGGSLRVRVAASIEDAVDGAAFVMNSIRVGGIRSRAHDERIAIEHGYPGQETTGPGGVAMALRTVSVAVEQAKLVERLSPQAWLINFTNPAGLITQAIRHHTGARVVGICDTPSEILHRIQTALGASRDEVRSEYVGLNHLGWIRRIHLRGEDVTERLLADDAFLSQIYSVPLFEHELIRALKLIPTEYLFFYYSRRRALDNQRRQGSTRGAEVEQLNNRLISGLAQLLQKGDSKGAIATYVNYLNTRSGSYMKLEGDGGSALACAEDWAEDPFRVASGYHRIALDVMNALCGKQSKRIVVNTQNLGSIPEMEATDIVEVSCRIVADTITPEPCGALPEAVRGLVLAVKAYERAAIEAALSGSELAARKAMLLYPAIGEWEPSKELLEQLIVHC